MGSSSNKKFPAIVYILFGYIDYVYIKIYTKKCYQHSYEFLNLMSSWGWGSKYSKSKWVGHFFIFGSKSSHIQVVILKIILAPFFLLKHHTRYKTYHSPSLRGPSTHHLYHEAQMRKLFQNLCVETSTFGVVVYNPGLDAHQKIVTLVG